MMRKGHAAAGSAVFFIVAPGVVAGLIPFWLTGWRMLRSFEVSLVMRPVMVWPSVVTTM